MEASHRQLSTTAGTSSALIKAGCDVFTVQRLLGHSTLVMTRRYSNLADVDVMDRHRQFSPSDRLGNLKNVGRKKIR